MVLYRNNVSLKRSLFRVNWPLITLYLQILAGLQELGAPVPRGAAHGHHLRPGDDFMNLHLGRKNFGQIFSLDLLTLVL
jgi:hypothetical protein